MSELYQLVYCSRNTVSDCSPDMAGELAEILQVSRRNNQRDNITGALLFSTGCFAQVLEGSREIVEQTFERIQSDMRHTDTTVLKFDRIEVRDYAAWAMADAGISLIEASVGLGLTEALAGSGCHGESVNTLLRSLVYRQSDWLSSAA